MADCFYVGSLNTMTSLSYNSPHSYSHSLLVTAEIFKPVTLLMGGCAQPHQSNSPSIVRNEAMDNMTNVGLVKVEVSSIDNNTSLMGLGRHDSRSRQQ